VIYVPVNSSMKPDGTLRDLEIALFDGRLKRLAIANPQHAPYGARAQDVLERVGLWGKIADKLIFSENIAQAAQYVAMGNAQAGLIAHSVAISPQVSSQGKYALISTDWHKPLIQKMVLINDSPGLIHRFFDYIQMPESRSVFLKHGFSASTVN
jgi:molybdate transport system substrate-binding protein